MEVNKARRAVEQKLRRLALCYNTLVVSDTASRKQVEDMHLALKGHAALNDSDRKELDELCCEYRDSFDPPQHAKHAKSRGEREVWKFHAAQFTYNSTDGDWASKDKVVLKGLSDRFSLFAQQFIPKFEVAGATATLEESPFNQASMCMHTCTCTWAESFAASAD